MMCVWTYIWQGVAHVQFFGTPFALPAMGEKGYLDIKVGDRLRNTIRRWLTIDHRGHGWRRT